MRSDPTTAPRVRLRLPILLESVVGRRELELRGTTVMEVLEAAFVQFPTLRHHLTVDGSSLRPYVLFILNGVSLDRSLLPSQKVADGDEVLIHQAIAGG